MFLGSKSATDLRLSRDAWLQRSLEVLREEGIVGVRVERLARDLHVTKGSFYWHFVDRDDLFTSLLEFWIQKYNDAIIKNPQFHDGDPGDGLLAAMAMVRKHGLDRYELAMRAWADHDERAEAAVRRVYKERSLFIRQFFTRLGFQRSQAEVRTRMVLCYMSWEPNMYADDSPSRRLNLLKQHLELLTTK